MAARALVTLILCHSVVAVPHATHKLAEGEGYGDSDSDGDGYSFGEGRGGGYGKGYGGGADTEPCSGPGAVLSAQSGSLDFFDGHADGDHCSWTIACPHSGGTPVLVFTEFQTEQGYDFVDVDELPLWAACYVRDRYVLSL
eukprot:COSAG06_NODE_18550_length_882_cov_0.782886_2_plen_141_part_00